MEGGSGNSSSSYMMIESGLYPLIMIPPLSHHHQNHNQNHNQNQFSSSSSAAGCYDLMNMETQTDDDQSIKAKIMAHPHYPRLISAFLNCQKVGAPAEVVARLEAVAAAMAEREKGGKVGYNNGGEDPSLDQFMEAYCEMLTKYEEEISKPFKEAMISLSRIESQFKALTLSLSSSSSAVACGEGANRNGSFEEDMDANVNLIDPSVEGGELKGHLLRKYSGYLGSLRQEFLKKRKKGKLPKEARQQLLDWWSRHYKWPYPSESQKLALAESTGLDQKQINNWFINQRKRHWKPSDDMQLVVMDAACHTHTHTHTHPHIHPHFNYANYQLLGNGNPSFPMDVSPNLM